MLQTSLAHKIENTNSHLKTINKAWKPRIYLQASSQNHTYKCSDYTSQLVYLYSAHASPRSKNFKIFINIDEPALTHQDLQRNQWQSWLESRLSST